MFTLQIIFCFVYTVYLTLFDQFKSGRAAQQDQIKFIEKILEENSTYQLDEKDLKYGENKTNHIFTIDNTNILKKKRSQFPKY